MSRTTPPVTPATPSLAGRQLLELELGGWSRKIAIPNELLSQLLTILDKCVVVDQSYMSEGAYVQTLHGRPGVTTQPASKDSYEVVPAEDKADYVEAYNAAYEVCKGTPAAGLPLVMTYAQFKAARK